VSEADERGVSYVMPIFNEVDYVEAAVASVLAQEYDGPVEILLALAPSTDGTDALVERLAADDSRIRIVRNPRRHIPVGLNLAISEARYPIVVRIDAHAELPAGYTSRGVAELNRVGAANLGGIMLAAGEPGLQAAIAKAYNSRLGLGGASYHAEDADPGPAESAYLGIMRADAVRSIGGFDESLRRGEDWEMNIDLLRGEGRRDTAPAVASEKYPVINTVRSDFDELLATLPDVAGRARELIARVQDVFSPENTERVAATLESVEKASLLSPTSSTAESPRPASSGSL
jgi:glycosyltransferase involved in cell wall biosynthesis